MTIELAQQIDAPQACEGAAESRGNAAIQTGSPAPLDTKRRIAVFDFDGTCIDGQSGLLFSWYLFRRGYLRLLRGLRLGWWGLRYTLHLPYRQSEAREVIFAALNEHSTDEILGLMDAFHDEVLLPRYRPAAAEEVAERRREGCVTLLVTATFKGIAEKAAAHLGVDGYLATEMERDNAGHFTGNVKGDVVAGPEKTARVCEWADGHIGRGRWIISYAYGDHHSDEDLLSHAEHPVAVCPGRTLRQEASRRGWPIADWKRKRA